MLGMRLLLTSVAARRMKEENGVVMNAVYLQILGVAIDATQIRTPPPRMSHLGHKALSELPLPGSQLEHIATRCFRGSYRSYI